MIIYKYKKVRTSSNLFSESNIIDESYMADDQVIIYYPRKLIDIPNSKVICILDNQFRAKVFRDNFMNELTGYIATMDIDRSKVIRNYTRDVVNFNNDSSIRFLYENKSLYYRVRGISVTTIITDLMVNVRDIIGNLRVN